MRIRLRWPSSYILSPVEWPPPAGVYAFVILKDGVTDSELEVTNGLQQLVRTHIGGFAVPEAFLVRVNMVTYGTP